MRPTPRKQAADRYFQLREFESRHPKQTKDAAVRFFDVTVTLELPLLRRYRYFGVTVTSALPSR